MYHARFKESHYEAGFKWGNLCLKSGNKIRESHTFVLNKERELFACDCIPLYQRYFPEILEEIRGIADGQKMDYMDLCTFLFSMYCFEFNNHCTCFAFKDKNNLIFARNSDFLVELEKLYMNCIYKLDTGYSFNANTTAFVQMEDGVNEYGLAVGLTFIYPHIRNPGLNAGMLVRFLLEKCSSVEEALTALKKLPIASAQALTIMDAKGDMVVVECNPLGMEIIYPNQDENFVVATNNFNSDRMKIYANPEGLDDWNSRERHEVAYKALFENKDNFSFELAKNILCGKYGFMCQYNRRMGADTVWSVIYDLKNKKIFRVEGNPSRKNFKEDTRLKLRD